MKKSIYQKNFEKYGFSPAQEIIINQVKWEFFKNPNIKVLEIGSSSGYMTKEFVSSGGIVDVVERDKDSVQAVSKVANNVYEGSIDDPILRQSLGVFKYDLIICADVLEHLVDPGATLKFLKTLLTPLGFFLISIPNAASWEMRKRLLLRGDFKYQESGLLDKTHLRFYSLNNFLDFLKELGFRAEEFLPAESRVPLELSVRKIPFFGNLFIDLIKSKIVKLWPNLLVYHYVVKATP